MLKASDVDGIKIFDKGDQAGKHCSFYLIISQSSLSKIFDPSLLIRRGCMSTHVMQQGHYDQNFSTYQNWGVVVIDGLRIDGLRIDGSRDFHDCNRNVASAISL